MKNVFEIARSKQAGITLVETAVALAIAAVVVSAAFAGFQANARRSEVRDNSQAVTEMIADTKQLYGQSNRYGELTTAAAINARIVPASMIDPTDATKTLNSYGGIADLNNDADRPDQAILTFAKVPQNQCMDLVASAERAASTVAISASTNTAVITSDALPDVVKTPAVDSGKLDMALVKDKCTGTEVDVVFVFGRN